MHIFVINLERDRERREFMRGQLDSLRLPFEFFPGVYGRALTPDQLAECYTEAGAMRIQCRNLTPSEIGCALGHLGVYRQIVSRKIPYALVLEDDAEIPKLQPEILEAIGKTIKPEHPSVVLLSSAKAGPARKYISPGNLQLGEFKGGCYAHAYIVTQLGARALLKSLYPVRDVADCWQRLNRHRVVDISVVSPPLAYQDQESFVSSTTVDICMALQNRRWREKAAFKFRRVFWLAVDSAIALYDRLANPYVGILKDESGKND